MGAKSIYLCKGQTSVKFDPAQHNYEKLIADGWVEYDPMQSGDSRCTDTHRAKNATVCMHGYTWWCPQAPESNWYPDAPYERDRARR